MNWTLVRKSIGESLLLLGSCAAGLVVFCWVRVWIISQIEVDRFQTILENLPTAIQRLLPVPIQDLLTYEGRLAFNFEEPIVYLIMAVWAIARGSDVVSGEMSRGTLEMLVAQPVSRLQIISAHGMVTVIGAGLLAAAAYAGMILGLHTCSATIVSEPLQWTVPLLDLQVPLSLKPPETRRVLLAELVDARLFLVAMINYACLGVFLTGVTMFLSSWDRYRWRTIGLAVGFYVVETLIELLAQSLQSVWMRRLTFFSAYEPVSFVTRSLASPRAAWTVLVQPPAAAGAILGPLGCDLLLVTLGGSFFLVGMAIFCHRDLPAPL